MDSKFNFSDLNMASYKSSKLFNLEERKRQTGRATTEIDIFQWKSTLIEELRKNVPFTEHLKTGATWSTPKVTNRGFEGENAAEKASAVESMLTKIASYAPSCLVRAINKRTTGIDSVWVLVRDWAGIQGTGGSKHLDYYRVKKSWNKDGDKTKQEFFYRLKDSMEDTLVCGTDEIKEDGKTITTDENMTPCLNSIVVLDWIEAIGGPTLVEHVHRVYAKDLETQTLGSLQSRISKNFESLMNEVEEQENVKINRTEIGRNYFPPSLGPHTPRPQSQRFSSQPWQFPAPSRGRGYLPFTPRNAFEPRPPFSNRTKQTNQKSYKICQSPSHFISSCPKLTATNRDMIAKMRQSSVIDTPDQSQDIPEDDDTQEDSCDNFDQYEEQEYNPNY